MTYNRFTYNSALYNAGRDEVGAIARSIIQAHTGPHIQAVVGGSPFPAANQDGISFISDFIIREGTKTKPPAAYNFPDLAARLRAVKTDVDDLVTFIKGIGFKNLPAAIYLVDHIPNLQASVFGLLQKDLLALILGVLAEKDLPASIVAAVANIAGKILGYPAPTLIGRISGHGPANLGALIWAPHDLPALIQSVNFGDVGGDIIGFGFKDLPGKMLGIPAPSFAAFIRAFVSGTDDLPAAIQLLADDSSLPGSIIPTIPGPNDFVGIIDGTGGYNNLHAALLTVIKGLQNLGALIKTGGEQDLIATIDFLGAKVLKGSIGAIPFGERNRELPAFTRGVHAVDLAALVGINRNFAPLGATIQSLRGRADLSAFLRAAETFITAILTVSTLSSRNLRATIGRPECEGGSAVKSMLAYLEVQHARNLSASVQAFMEKNLGALINAGNLIHALDVINVLFSPKKVKKTKTIKASDTVQIRYSPFRGQNLGASIFGELARADLAAVLKAAFPLPRVAPKLSRLTAADLRADRDLNIQEIRFQLEGALLEFIYVNGTDEALIFDPSQQWRINVRSFKPIAENLFGNFAAARICRLGSLTSFSTIDEAVRACIAAVLGVGRQSELPASIVARGQRHDLRAFAGVTNHFSNLAGLVGRVYPADFAAEIQSTGQLDDLYALIWGVGFGTAGLSASIQQASVSDLEVSITGV